MDQNKEKIALFIDADNAPAKKVDVIVSELAKHGVLNIRRAYGNWKSSGLKTWELMLHEYAIQPVQQFDLTKGKNATDMAMTIDAMDVLFNKPVDTFCIVSSDCDFTPLVTRLLADGKTVIGFGERKAPDAFVNACSRFLYLDDESVETTSEVEIPKKETNLKGNTKLIKLLRNAVDACEEDEGWAFLGKIGSNLANQGSFDQRNYGFKKLSDLFAAIDLFEIKTSNGSLFWVRNKKAKAKATA